MPIKRKSTKRKFSKKGKRVGKSLTTYRPKYQSGIPAQQFVKLVYEEDALEHLLTLGAPWLFNSYQINSLFKPRQSAGGHQPRFFDQWTAMYERYRVTSCTVEVTAYNKTPSGVATVFMIPLAFNQPVFTGSQQAFEHKKASSRTLTDQKPVKMIRHFTIHQVEGVLRSVTKIDQDYSTGVGATPPAAPTVQVAVSALFPGQTNNIVLRTKLTYYATMYQPKTVGAS